MIYLKKLLIITLAFLTLTFFLPKLSSAQEQLKDSEVPKHEPRNWSTPEQEIPSVKVKKISSWTWLILLALIGGAATAAAIAGGIGNGGGGSDIGSYTGTW